MSELNHVVFISNIIRPLCDFPDELVVDAKDDEKGTLINVYVDQQDMGRVLGRGGETVNAIRLLLRIYAVKSNMHFGLKINTKEQ